MKNDVVVELKDIRKEFPGVVALDRVNMKIKAGRVHALVGENGAGKSTLMKILSGSYGQYEGQIILDGEVTFFRSEKDALNKGIAIVSQELNYAPELTITGARFPGQGDYGQIRLLRKKK